MAEGRCCESKAIPWITLDCLSEQTECGNYVPFFPRISVRQATQVEIIGRKVSGGPIAGSTNLSSLQCWLDDANNAECHLVLKLEYIFQRAVDAIGPEMRAANRVDKLSSDAYPTSRPTCFTSTDWPLYVKLLLRAMTKSQGMRESAVMISSTIPSAKYSCSGSPLIFWNGSTAIDGLSGKASDGPVAVPTTGLEGLGCVLSRMRWTRIGRVMFLTCCSPISSNEKASLSRTWSRTTRLTQIPPGSARASRRAAMLTPSPYISRPSLMMSPTLIPMRSSIRRSGGTSAFRSAISR